MDVFKYYQLLNFIRDILILLQILFIFYLGLKEIKKDTRNGLFFLFKFFFVFTFIFLLINFLRATFPEPRPISYFFPSFQTKDSFPSAHTALSFSLTFLLLSYNFRDFIFSLIISILIAVLSIVSLAHWPQDVIYSFLIGFLLGLVLQEALNFFHRFYTHKLKPKS